MGFPALMNELASSLIYSTEEFISQWILYAVVFASSAPILVKRIGSFMLQLLNRSDQKPSILYYRDLLFYILACGDLTG